MIDPNVPDQPTETGAPSAPPLLDLDHLEVVALEAAEDTPGEWFVVPSKLGSMGREPTYVGFNGKIAFPEDAGEAWCKDEMWLATADSHEQQAHIAAFDPPTALTLIARVRVLERAVGHAVSQLGSGWLGTAEATLRATMGAISDQDEGAGKASGTNP